MIVSARSDIGLIRKINEDGYYWHECRGGVFAAVCDGMGGAAGGEIASSMTLDAVKDILTEGLSDSLSENEIRDLMTRAVESANEDLLKAQIDNPTLRGMGTTIVMAYVTRDLAYIMHMGDSRAYLSSDKEMHRLTKDHSYVQDLIDSGAMTEAEAEESPYKNIITRAVGTDRQVYPSFGMFDVVPGDMIILCSDGLTNYVGEDTIFSLSRSVDQPADILAQAALSGGGGDNVTVVTLKLEE